MELLGKPKIDGRLEGVRDYEYYLATFPYLALFPLDLEIARKASDFRAVARIRTPDAVPLATAIHHGATGFLTNDRILEKAEGEEEKIGAD